MISVSNDFKAAMKQPVKEIQAYLDYGDAKISDSDNLISYKISCDSSLCKTAMRKLEAKYLGEQNLLGKWVRAVYGVRLADGSFEFLDYGSFLVTETTFTKDTGTTSIVAYDKMVNAMTPYATLNIEYPVSLIDYTRVLCDSCGLELGSDVFGKNIVPSLDSGLWELSNGAFINSDGNLELPDMKSIAKVRFNWNQKDSKLFVQMVLVSGGNYHYNLSYYDENGTRLNGNGNATTEKKADGFLSTVRFGWDDQYSEAIQNAKYIELSFGRTTNYAPEPYVIKNITAGNDIKSDVSAYEPYNPMNNWQITQELWENIEGITYRDILVQIAQATGSTCIIGADDKVYFKGLIDTGESLTYDNLFKLKLENVYGPINSIVLSRTPSEDNIYKQDEESARANGLTEFKIENNEIIDKDRENAIIPIFNALNGISYYPFEATTEGLGWYEIGDKIDIVNDVGDVFNTSLFNYSITIDGSIKETLKTSAETKTQTQYQYATTIAKRVKNTEVIVNKQEQYIKQLVSDIDGVNEKYTQIYQDIDNIINSVQNSGGNNLIPNSVMFAYDSQNVPTEWTLEGDGEHKIQVDTESLNFGGTSGHSFTLLGKKATQRIQVNTNSTYTFSTKIKKNATGTCYVKLYNSMETHIKEIPSGVSAYYDDYEIKAIAPKENYYIVEFYGSEDSEATFTDNMFALGEYKSQWTQANGEVMNTQVNININGVLVKSSMYPGSYTVMSPLEFAGYSNVNGTITRVFSLNEDITDVEKLRSKSEISMLPIKVVPIPDGDWQGWAFVPATEGV